MVAAAASLVLWPILVPVCRLVFLRRKVSDRVKKAKWGRFDDWLVVALRVTVRPLLLVVAYVLD